MIEKILNGLEESYPMLVFVGGLMSALIYLMYINFKNIFTKNIEEVENNLMKSIDGVKNEMIDNANKIKVGVDQDVVILKQDQLHLSSQINDVKDNIHKLGNKMQGFGDKIAHVDRTMIRVNNTLTLMSIQMGGNLSNAIKDSIDSMED